LANIPKPTKSVLYDLTRIGEWYVLSIAFVFFGFVPYLARYHDDFDLEIAWNLFTTPPLYIVLAIVFCAQMFLFASNDYFDKDVDAMDPQKKQRNPVSAGRVSYSEVMVLLTLTALIPMVLSVYFGLWVFLFTAMTMLIFLYYTAEPLRFKSKVGLDVLSHGVFINTFPYLFTILALRDFAPAAIYLLLLIMGRSTIAQMLQEIRDVDVDSQVERNTVIALGRTRAAHVVFGIALVMTFGTLGLMISRELFGWGIRWFFLLVFFFMLIYIIPLYRIVKAVEDKESIEKLWMGQGRTNRNIGIMYVSAIALYFVIFFIFLYPQYA